MVPYPATEATEAVSQRAGFQPAYALSRQLPTWRHSSTPCRLTKTSDFPAAIIAE